MIALNLISSSSPDKLIYYTIAFKTRSIAFKTRSTAFKTRSIAFKTRFTANKQKKRTRHRVDFAVPTDNRVKINESEKMNYLDLGRELRKLRNMKMTAIPLIVGALGRVLKSF